MVPRRDSHDKEVKNVNTGISDLPLRKKDTNNNGNNNKEYDARDPEKTQTPEEVDTNTDPAPIETELSAKKITDSKMRRHLHIRSEQRRREKIIDGFSKLKILVPTIEDKNESKSSILNKTIDYIYTLQEQNQNLIINYENLKEHNTALQHYIATNSSNFSQNNQLEIQNYSKPNTTVQTPNVINVPSYSNYQISPQNHIPHCQPPPPPPQAVSQIVGPPPGASQHPPPVQTLIYVHQHSAPDLEHSQTEQGSVNHNHSQQSGSPMQQYYYPNSGVYEIHPQSQTQRATQSHYQVPIVYGGSDQPHRQQLQQQQHQQAQLQQNYQQQQQQHQSQSQSQPQPQPQPQSQHQHQPRQEQQQHHQQHHHQQQQLDQQQQRDSSYVITSSSSPSLISNKLSSSRGELNRSNLSESQLVIRQSLPSLKSLINNEQAEFTGTTPVFHERNKSGSVQGQQHSIRSPLLNYGAVPQQSSAYEESRPIYKEAGGQLPFRSAPLPSTLNPTSRPRQRPQAD